MVDSARARRANIATSQTSGSVSSVRRGPKRIAVTLLLLAVVVSTGTTVQAILIGHSNVTAVWSEDMGTPAPASDED